MKNTKRSVLVSGLCLLLTAVMLMGSTFAWFTDSVTNEGNKIQSGTLDISLNNGDETTLFSSEGFLFEPGRSQVATATVTNEGSLWLKYAMHFANVKITGDADITEVLDVYKVAADANSLEGAEHLGTMKELMAAGRLDEEGVLAPKGYTGNDGVSSETFTLVIKMQESAGNKYQNCGVTFDVVVNATQYTYEQDGFGENDYDAGATLEFVSVEAGTDPAVNGERMRRAIDGAPAGAYVQVEAGTYSFTSTQVFTKPIHLVGEGEVVLDFSNAAAPVDGGYNTQAALLILASDVTIENVTVYGKPDQFAIAIVGLDNVGAAGVADGNITVTDELNYDFDWAVNEFYPEYTGVYENVNFYNCTFGLKEAGTVSSALFLESRYTVVQGCTFENVQASSAVVKIEEDHVKVLDSTFQNCTGAEYAEAWCGAAIDGDGIEYPGHPFKCEEGWNNMVGEVYAAHVAYAASRGWNHSAEQNP